MHGPSEGVSEETDEANSAVKIVGGNVFVELDPDHPGFKDEGYRSRRNEIAKIALEWNEMSMDERRSKRSHMLHIPKMKMPFGLRLWKELLQFMKNTHVSSILKMQEN